MAVHTFYCETCCKHFDSNVPHQEMPRTEPCPDCKAPCKKDFTFMRGHVINDTWKRGQRLVSLKGMPYVESNSDVKRAIAKHDHDYGTKLEAW